MIWCREGIAESRAQVADAAFHVVLSCQVHVFWCRRARSLHAPLRFRSQEAHLMIIMYVCDNEQDSLKINNIIEQLQNNYWRCPACAATSTSDAMKQVKYSVRSKHDHASARVLARTLVLSSTLRSEVKSKCFSQPEIDPKDHYR